MRKAAKKYPPTLSEIWSKRKKKCKKRKVTPMHVDAPIHENKIRFVCISDTHGRHDNYRVPIPNGDVLLHAGDFTKIGGAEEVEAFNTFLASLPHLHKVVIAGNHDFSFDTTPSNSMYAQRTRESLEKRGLRTAHSLLTDCCYLENNCAIIAGYKIFGSPNSVAFGDWAFMYNKGAAATEQWNQIPDDTAILMTHGPPLGYGDRLYNGQRSGCLQLLDAVQARVRPLYHVFGHIHEASGVHTDGRTTFINASICDLRYDPSNPPMIFDLPMPEGMTKAELHGLSIKPEPIHPPDAS